MKKYRIELQNDATDFIEVDNFYMDDGALVFIVTTSAPGASITHEEIVRVYAPTTWNELTLLDSEDLEYTPDKDAFDD